MNGFLLLLQEMQNGGIQLSTILQCFVYFLRPAPRKRR
ncbi:hypothetical protein Pint_02592 [Pistacia integerrima]|uniref:Uncharacterized protein n=2 Tax=Pistacia TaxID=55512 RepID=A0ACC1CAD7_9ROSI|nr:hypothetical protein Pint_02592 [Pistacia integerrima]KAJ0112482.1 hypothetical protein Patl1_02622 [Pistacia atlantica]